MSSKWTTVGTKEAVRQNKQWPHAPEALLRGRLVYVVKFYGDQQVENPKGVEPVKEAIRKMKFNKQQRKAEGQKTTPKVELLISVDGISLQDPKSKVQQYKYPLHHISYCADDKAEKKLFTFIAKDGATGTHRCFVLGSDRCAEEITLTIGQAFDLAYKRFLEKQGSQMDQQKQFILSQQQVQELQNENRMLRQRVAELEQAQLYVNAMQTGNAGHVEETRHALKHASNSEPVLSSVRQEPTVGRKLENLLFDDDFNVIPEVGEGPSYSSVKRPTNSVTLSNGHSQVEQNSFSPKGVDAFGMPAFTPNELAEQQRGFGQGLAMGTDDLDIFNPRD